jgi:hypothetical protein
MEKTNEDLAKFFTVANHYKKKYPKRIMFLFGIEKVLRLNEPAHKALEEALSDAYRENAAVDSDEVLLTNPDGSFRYTKEGLAKRDKAEKEILARKVKVHTYFEARPPKNLDSSYLDAFVDFVIRDLPPYEQEEEEEESSDKSVEVKQDEPS